MPRYWHYHVIESTPGYMPDDDDPPIVTSHREAVAIATMLARELREDGYHGRTAFARDDYGRLERDTADLGRTILIEPCNDFACLIGKA